MRIPDPSIIQEAISLMDLRNSVKNEANLVEFRHKLDEQIVALCQAFAKELMNARQ